MAFLRDNTIKPQDDDLLIKTPLTGGKVSKCMTINGNLASYESLVVDGRIDGNIVCNKRVIVESGATVLGKIRAKEVRIEGILKGPIEADIIEVGKSAVTEGYMIANSITISGKCDGDILAENTLIIEDGADATTLEAKSKIIKVSGTIRGDITAVELLEIDGNGLIDGNIKTKEYFSSSGSKVTGTIRRYVGYVSKDREKSNSKAIEKDKSIRVARRVD